MDYGVEYHSYDIEYNVIYLFISGVIFDDLVWYGIGIMKYIHTRYCIVCIVSILCRYYSNMSYISLIHRYFIASLFLYFRVFIVFVSYNSYYEVNGPCFRKQHVNLNDYQLNLRYKLLRPKSSCFFIFVTILVWEKQWLIVLYIVFLVLVIQHGSFSGKQNRGISTRRPKFLHGALKTNWNVPLWVENW